MGSGIASLAARSGFAVLLHDASSDALSRAEERITAGYRNAIDKGHLTSPDADAARRNLRADVSADQLAGCSLIIEAIVEDLAAKRTLFASLDTLCPPETLFATNTSSLSVTALGGATRRPGSVLGLHFFNPPAVMKLVEVVRGAQTSEAAMRAGVAFVEALGRIPIVTKDTPGFIVNRVARPFYGEALRILGEGVASVEEIDRIVRLEGGFRMGPFELMDLIGIDVNLSVTQSIYEQTFHEPRYRPHIIQQTMVNAGILGRKTKRGFYSYPS